MNIKIKLIQKKTDAEESNFEIMSKLKNHIENYLYNHYPEHTSIVKLYGEIIPIIRK